MVNNGTTAQIGLPGAVAGTLNIGSTVDETPASLGSMVQLLPGGNLTVGAGNVLIGPQGTLRFSGGAGSGPVGSEGTLNANSIQNNGGIVFDGSFDHVMAIPVNGNGAYTMAGTGTLTVNAKMGDSPNVLVNSGVLIINSNAIITSGNISVNGGTAQIAAAGEAVTTLTIGTTVSGSTLQMLPGGGLTVGNGTGNVLIGAGGTLRFSGGGTSGGTLSAGVFQNSGSIVFDGPLDHTLNTTVTGSGNFIMAGTGALTVNAKMGDSPNVLVNSGLLTINSNSAITNGAISVNGGTAQIAATGEAVTTLTIGTTVAGSTLQMLPGGNLTVANPVVIGPGGTLRFSGGVDGSGVNRGGTIFVSAFQDNGNILLDGPFNHSITVPVTGSGKVTMAGTGTLTLSSTNTYSGATVISSGTVLAGATTGLSPNSTFLVDSILDLSGFSNTIGSLSGTGTVLNGGTSVATLTVGHDNTNTIFSGTLKNGTSGLQLIKSGTGTLTLTGDNTHTGGTTISAGTLQLGNGGTTGSIAGNVTNNGILAFDRSDVFTFAGAISGTGSLTQIGTGIAILTGNNTYAGGTTISTGTLQAGSATGFSPNSEFTVNSILDLHGFNNTIGSLLGTGAVLNDGATAAALTVGSDNASTSFNGVLRDGASALQLIKTGTGKLTLTGNNTYTGGTTISTGALQIGNGGTTGSITGDVIDNGTLAFNRSDAVTFSGVISGVGSLVKEGAGTLRLPSANNYKGTTTIDAGSLIVDGSIASPQTVVNVGALLGGHGTIGGNLVNGGIVSPGNSPGTLTVTSDYTQNGSATLRIEVAGLANNQHDLLAVGGHVTLGGTLQLVRLGNFNLQPGNQITFLTANQGISGAFNNVQNDFATGTIVRGVVTSSANVVVLEGQQGSFTQIPGVTLTGNQSAVGNMLNSAASDPRAAALIAFLNSQPVADLPHDYNLIAPTQVSSINATAVSVGKVQISNVGQRLVNIHLGSTGFSSAGFAISGSAASFGEGFAGVSGPEGKSGTSVLAPTPENRWGVFLTGLGEFTNVDSTPNAAGYDVDTGGFTLGVDYRLTPNFVIGLTGGYAHDSVSINGGGGDIGVNAGQIGVYATAFANGFYLDAAVSGGPSGYDTHRTALQGTARGDTNGGNVDVLVAGGYDWKCGNLTFGPTASFQYSYVGLNGFTESGSLAPLTFPDQNTQSERTAFGAKASYNWTIGHVIVIPQLSLAWQHEYGATTYSVVAALANGAGNSFTVVGPPIGRDSLLIGAGAAVILNDRVSTYLYYDGEVARTNYDSNSVTGGVRITF